MAVGLKIQGNVCNVAMLLHQNLKPNRLKMMYF